MSRNMKEKRKWEISREDSDTSSHSYRRVVTGNTRGTDKTDIDKELRCFQHDDCLVWCCRAAAHARQMRSSPFGDDGDCPDARSLLSSEATLLQSQQKRVQ